MKNWCWTAACEKGQEQMKTPGPPRRTSGTLNRVLRAPTLTWMVRKKTGRRQLLVRQRTRKPRRTKILLLSQLFEHPPRVPHPRYRFVSDSCTTHANFDGMLPQGLTAFQSTHQLSAVSPTPRCQATAVWAMVSVCICQLRNSSA
ncbi:unnamed protein product [Trichogramma brassicae]|uniref:Uncharacterized protein n=1 Tax=Trichogramma brassicae TaxID=86971 RepID=A0A6H5I1T2_9HYME|nr:unnamed protein product [Trichogramma brassicae]